jgi:MFS transporter, Spinster family, sphingosine-1-phosphate transporter
MTSSPNAAQEPSAKALNSRRSRMLILALLTAANFIGYAARNALFQAYDDLRGHFHVDNQALGQLGTAFMAAQAAATIPFGWAGDRFDRRKVIGFGVLVASVAGVVGPLLHSFPALLISRALVGLGLAVIVPVANSILGELFDGNVKASRIAIFNLGLFVGGAVGLAGGQFVGYPWILYACALPGFALALAITRLPVAPHRAAAGDAAAQTLAASLAQARALLRIRTLRLLMVSTTAMAFAAGGFVAWFPEFLRHDKHLSEQQTTMVMAVSLVAGLFGVVTGGRLGDYWHRRARAGRLWTIALGMAATVPCVIACILLPAGPGLVVASMVTIFFVSWYHAPMAATVDDLASAERAATAQAVVVFTMHILGTAPSSWVIGALSDRIGLGAALWVPTAALAVAALAMMAAVPSFADDSDRARAATS